MKAYWRRQKRKQRFTFLDKLTPTFNRSKKGKKGSKRPNIQNDYETFVSIDATLL